MKALKASGRANRRRISKETRDRLACQGVFLQILARLLTQSKPVLSSIKEDLTRRIVSADQKFDSKFEEVQKIAQATKFGIDQAQESGRKALIAISEAKEDCTKDLSSNIDSFKADSTTQLSDAVLKAQEGFKETSRKQLSAAVTKAQTEFDGKSTKLLSTAIAKAQTEFDQKSTKQLSVAVAKAQTEFDEKSTKQLSAAIDEARTEFDKKLPDMIAKIEDDIKKKVSDQINQLQEAYKDKIEQLTTDAKDSKTDALYHKDRAEKLQQQLTAQQEARSVQQKTYASFKGTLDTLVDNEKTRADEKKASTDQFTRLRTDFSTTQKAVNDVLPRVKTCEHRLNSLSLTSGAVDDLQKSVQAVKTQSESHQKTIDTKLVKLENRQNGTAAEVQRLTGGESKRNKQRLKNTVLGPVKVKEGQPSQESPLSSPASAASNQACSAPPSPPTSPESERGSARDAATTCKDEAEQPVGTVKHQLDQSIFAPESQRPKVHPHPVPSNTAPGTALIDPKLEASKPGEASAKPPPASTGASNAPSCAHDTPSSGSAIEPLTTGQACQVPTAPKEELHDPKLADKKPVSDSAKSPSAPTKKEANDPKLPSQKSNAGPVEHIANASKDSVKLSKYANENAGNISAKPFSGPPKKAYAGQSSRTASNPTAVPSESQPTAQTFTPNSKGQDARKWKEDLLKSHRLEARVVQLGDELKKAEGGFRLTFKEVRAIALQQLRTEEPHEPWPAS